MPHLHLLLGTGTAPPRVLDAAWGVTPTQNIVRQSPPSRYKGLTQVSWMLMYFKFSYSSSLLLLPSPGDSGWSLLSSLCESLGLCYLPTAFPSWPRPLLWCPVLPGPSQLPALPAECTGVQLACDRAGGTAGQLPFSLPLLLWMLLPLPQLRFRSGPAVLWAAGCVQGTQTEPRSGSFPHCSAF